MLHCPAACRKTSTEVYGIDAHLLPRRAHPTQDDLFSVVWEALLQHIRHRTFTRITPAASLKSLATQWIQGAPFHALLKILTAAKARIGTGPRPRKPQLDHVVDICENAFAYDGMLVLGAVTELTRLHFPHNKVLLDDLQILQKRLKYGLARTAAIALYELGFADRVLASELAPVVGAVESRAAAKQAIHHHEDAIREVLPQYPPTFPTFSAPYEAKATAHRRPKLTNLKPPTHDRHRCHPSLPPDEPRLCRFRERA